MTSAPSMRVPPPGPRSRELLERLRAVAYPGLSAEFVPFVINAEVRLGGRGRRRQRLPRLHQRHGLGAARRRRAPTSSSRVIEALRRYGNEDTHSTRTSTCCRSPSACSRVAPASLTRVDIALNGTEAVETAIRFMRRATGRPIDHRVHGRLPRRDAAPPARSAPRRRDLSFGYRALMPGFAHVPYPNPYRTPFTARAGRDRRRHRRLHPRPPAVPRGRPARGGRRSSSSRCSARAAASPRPRRSGPRSSSSAASSTSCSAPTR